MLRETDGTLDKGYTHAWTQVRAALRPRGIARMDGTTSHQLLKEGEAVGEHVDFPGGGERSGIAQPSGG
eukprot:1614129-Prymnesium_polylepis.1